MAETTNFGLYVTDDTNETFSSWREKMNATTNSNMTIIDAALDEIENDSDNHIANTNNPHNVTKTQVGLGNVPNVATNDQTPTFTQYTGQAQGAIISSGETLSTIFGKLKRLGSDFFSHIQASNPHNITKSTVGLDNVPNVSTNDQTPTYTEASSNTALSSGEKLSVAMGKIAKIVSSFIAHLSATNPHNITVSGIGAAASSHTHSEYAASGHTHTAAAVGAATSSHSHGNITNAGALGTSEGYAVVTGTDGVLTIRSITHNATGALSTNSYLITERTMRYHSNRSTGAASPDTNYTTNMFRGIALYSSDTNPSYNGQINFTYG